MVTWVHWHRFCNHRKTLFHGVYFFACIPTQIREASSSVSLWSVTQWLGSYNGDMCFVFHHSWQTGLIKHYPYDGTVFGMMTSSNGIIFRVTGPLCGEFTGHHWIPRSKASDAEHWCFLWSAWINGWVHNREAGDLRRYRAHYDVTVMKWGWSYPKSLTYFGWLCEANT